MIYIVLFLLSFFLTLNIKNLAVKKSLVAKVTDRSSHSIPTPHGGGIAIAITWIIGLFYLYYNEGIDSQLFFALLAGLIISFISFLDDIYELSAKVRLIVQSLVAITGLILLGGLNTIDFGFFIIDNQIVTNIFAFLLIIWFINLYNFLDGINGYAGSEAVFLSFAGFIIFSDSHFLILMVSVLGFLFWNYNNAKIFMGDVGSTLLGYTIAIFALYYTNNNSLNLWIWIILFSLFWYDATITLLRRKINKEKLSVAHKKHAYQRLTQSGWSHLKVTNFSIIINLIILMFLIFISSIIVNIILTIILLFFVMRFVDKKKSFYDL